MTKNLIHIISWILLIYLGYCGVLFLLQRHIMFPRDLVEVPETIPDLPGLKQVWLQTEDGRTEAWFFPPELRETDTGPSPAVIFAHGNGEVIDAWPDELDRFSKMGVGLLLVEYPGYGRSEGSPTQESITRTFDAAYDWLAKRLDVDPARIILMGRSLGGGAVCQLAARRPSAAMILLSTFTSARSFASQYFVPGFIVQDTFDNLAVIRNYPMPVLLFHGRQDRVIPFDHSLELVQAAPKARLVSWECGHNDCPPNQENFWHEIRLFLRTSGIIGSTYLLPE